MKHDSVESPLTAEVCVAALKTCCWLGVVSIVLLVCAVIGGIVVAHARLLWALSAGAGLIVLYYHTRLIFDGKLFAILARPGMSDADFDAALGLVLGSKGNRTTRTLAERWNGTRRLVRRFVLSLIVQCVAMLAALLINI